jgi:hypothetical protein
MLLFSLSGLNEIYAIDRIPLVVITDLYHPYQDPGDNFELINAYAIPTIDLKAVIIDCYNPFRKKHATAVSKGLFEDPNGPREPGIVCVQQLNYIFNKNIPFGIGPFEPMRYKKDKMEYLSYFFNQGVDLLKKTLESSNRPISIASFGSSRILAVAYNRFPKLMKKKIKMIYLSAGTCGNNSEYLEWNVALDTIAFVSLLESGLPISLYPCASGKVNTNINGLSNAFTLDKNNTYYKLNSLSFIERMNPKLRQYCSFIYNRYKDVDYLAYLERNDSINPKIVNSSQHVWETAIWMNIANLKLVKSSSGHISIISKDSIKNGDTMYDEKLLKCDIKVLPSGVLKYNFNKKGCFNIYEREDPILYQSWMNEAIPAFYISMLK